MKKYLIIVFILLGNYILNAQPGIGIVQDKSGNIYYTDLKYVWKVFRDGKKEIVVRDVLTHELFMDERDNLFGEHLKLKQTD